MLLKPHIAAIAAATLLAACGGSNSGHGDTSPTAPATAVPMPSVFAAVGYTYHDSSGNRLVTAGGRFPNAVPIDITLDGVPKWLLSAPRSQDESLWVAVLHDGRVRGFVVDGVQVTPITVTPAVFDTSLLPTLVLDSAGAPFLLSPHSPAPASGGATAVISLSDNKFAYVDGAGNLVVSANGDNTVLALNAMPNARILVDEQQRLLLLCDPSDRYSHDVLHGNSTANSIALVATQPTLALIRKIAMPAPTVVEGNALIWVDMNGDTQREIVITVSDSRVGSALAIYSEDGNLIAQSDAIGSGFRWHHQIAVAPFRAANVPELVVTRTPHIGGVTEFYHLDGTRLLADAAMLGYTSHHQADSPNIDMALAADLDGDAQPEALIPSEDFTRLGGIGHFGANDLRVKWQVDIGGQLTTNLSALDDGTGHLIVGVGHSKNALRIWR
jgi:hypothetical protein